MSKKNYGSYAAAALLAWLVAKSIYDYSKTSEVASINAKCIFKILLLGVAFVFFILASCAYTDDTSTLGFMICMIILWYLACAIVLEHNRKNRIYKVLNRDRDIICNQYDLDRQMFRGIDITRLENNADVQSVVNKMWFEPQHWLYRCKDGSRDLRYTRSNEVIPDSWYMVLQANNIPYLLASGSQDNIAQIGIKLYYGSGIEIETL